MIAAAGLVALLQVAALGGWLSGLQVQAGGMAWAATGNHLAEMSTRFAVAAVCVVFVPTVLLGVAFPVALRVTADARHIGRDVGAVVALNTLGGIAGTLLTGFVLVPALGLVRTLATLAIAAAAIGIVAVMRGPAVRQGALWATLTIGMAALLGAILTPPDRLARLLPAARAGTLVFYEESQGGTVAVVQQQAGPNHFKRLYIQGVSNSGDALPSLRYMRLQALLPLLIHRGEPRSALIIGLGTGITAGTLLRFPGLEQRVCAEILPAVIRAALLFQGNFGAASDRGSRCACATAVASCCGVPSATISLPSNRRRRPPAASTSRGLVGTASGASTVTSYPSGKRTLFSSTTTPFCTRPRATMGNLLQSRITHADSWQCITRAT